MGLNNCLDLCRSYKIKGFDVLPRSTYKISLAYFSCLVYDHKTEVCGKDHVILIELHKCFLLSL